MNNHIMGILQKGLDFNDVLLIPQLNTKNIKSRQDIVLKTTYTFANESWKNDWTGIPIIASNMSTIGTIQMYKTLSKFQLITCFSKHIPVDQFPIDMNPDYFMISTGISNADLNRLEQIMQKIVVKFICIDVANGYLQQVQDVTQQIRAKYPMCILIVGNVCTPDAVQALKEAGADIVKCGIGSGSCCTTRIKTGCGLPQLTTIRLCSSNHCPIISDGGIKCPGDIVKAFASGSEFVMLGGILAGHDECDGEIIEKNNKKFKCCYGMASKKAMNRYGGSTNYKTAEGKEVLTPYKGPVESTIQDILGGLRSACTYLNAKSLSELTKSYMIEVNQQYNNMFDKYTV